MFASRLHLHHHHWIVVVAVLVLAAASAVVRAGPVSGSGEAPNGPLFRTMAQAYGLNRDDLLFDWLDSETTSSAFESYVSAERVYFTTHGPLDSSLTGTDSGALTQVPLAGGALVAAYRLAGSSSPTPIGDQAQLVLDGPTLARVWSGAVVRWNDSAIAALNPYLVANGLLPDADITLYYSDDVRGSLSELFLGYVCSHATSPTTCRAGGFAGLVPSGRSFASAQRAADVLATPNSLTFLGLAEATAAQLSVAAMRANGTTTNVQPTAAAITSAMTDATAQFNSLAAAAAAANTTAAAAVLGLLPAKAVTSWPMTYLVYGTFFAASNSSAQCLYLNEYLLWLSWMLLNDNAAASAAGTLHPIVPYDWKRTVLDSLSTVTCLGRQVSSTAYLVGMGSSNPLPTLGRYYPASRFVLKYFIGNTDLSVKSLAEGTIDFGQTSAPISAERMQQAPDIMTVPAMCWGIVPAYNLPELVGLPFAGLRMNWSLISDIYLSHVTMWNDPQIAELNPEVADHLPNRAIKIVYQINRSTVSLVFNRAISRVVPEYASVIGPVNHFDNSSAAQSARGIGVQGFGFPQAIEANTDSFGLCTSMEIKGKIRGIYMANPAGNWVTASAASVLSAIEDYESELDLITFLHGPGPQSFPITLLTAVTVRSRSMTDCAKAAVLVDWLYWMQTSAVGRDILDSSNYVPAYPFEGFLNVLRLKLINVTCQGVAVSSLVGCVDETDGRLCSDHGTCATGGRCLCREGWAGRLCELEATSLSGDGSDSQTTLAIALGVTLPVVGLLLCVALLAVIVGVRVGSRRGDDRYRKDYYIDLAELEIGPQLGQGGFGEVYKATWKGTEVAVKLMPEGAAASRDARENFVQEVAIMSTLRHPNVVLFMAACTKAPKLCIVMEYMALGSLYDLLHNELVPEIPLSLKLRMVHQAAKGMHFLHASDIVHRDFKSLNLLLDNKWNVKVADFGLTKFRDSVKHKQGDDGNGGGAMVGSVPWMAPEVLQEETNCDFRLADIYSFGIVLWEVLTRDQPYAGMAPPQVAVLVITQDLRPRLPRDDQFLGDGERAMARLTTKCWQRDAPMRPDFIEIMQVLVDIGNAHGGVSSGLFGTGTSSSGSSSHHHSSALLNTGTTTLGVRSTGSASSSHGNQSGHSSATSSSGHSGIGGGGGGAAPSAPKQLRLAAPRRDVSFVVCDLAEFDRVWQASPTEAERAIELYGALVRQRGQAELGSHLFSLPALHSGGTFMLAFGDPANAARFALALRRDLLARDNPRLTGCWRVSIDHRPDSCPAPADDHTRTGYERRDFADACRLNTRCPLGGIVCSAAFGRRLQAAMGGTREGLEALVHLVERRADGGASLRVFDASDRDLDEQLNRASEEEGEARGDEPDDDDDEDDDDEDDEYGQPRSTSHAATAEASGLCSSNACHWIINTERIKLGEVLGEGNYGKVTEGQYFGTRVAVKRLFNSRLDDARMRRMRREAAILSNLDHPRVVKLIGLALADDAGHHSLQLVMELVPRGSLRGVLSNASISDRSLPWAKRLSMLRDAALGLEFLHGNGVLHRDIKSSNLLVDDDWSVKVGDFGFATAKQDNATMTRCGTPCWTAPEILCPPLPTNTTTSSSSSSPADPPPKANYTEAADVYSFGIVMWEVLTRKVPYAEGNMMTVVHDVLAGKRPRVPSDCPQAFAGLMERCWHRKPGKRPTMNEVLLHLNSQLDSLPL